MKAIARSLPFLLLALAPLAAGAPAKAPEVKVGDTFEYVTTGTAPEKPAAQMATAQGQGMIIPLPNSQVVRVTGEQECPQGTCFTIEVEQILPPFVPQLADQNVVKQIRALIHPASGEVRDVHTTLRMGSSVSESDQEEYQRESTVGEFFGPWMADIDDGYTRSFERMGGEVRTLTVTGREKVAGRDCLVVRRTRLLVDGQKVEATLWIDAARRVMLQVEQGGQRMKLASKPG